MRNYSLLFIASVISTTIAGKAYAWNPFKTQTFEECVLENMKNVTSDAAAAAIKQSCHIKTNKLAEKKCAGRSPSPREFGLVAAQAQMTDYGTINIQIHNGNRDLTITDAEATIAFAKDDKLYEYALRIGKGSIPPLTTGEASATVLHRDAKLDWFLVRVKVSIGNCQ
jgi:hypothetical protein